MKKRKIKTGLIGCGKVGKTHADILKSLPESDFTAVASRSEESAKNFGTRYNVSWYTNIEEMLEKSGLEAVVICTPHPVHKYPAVEAAKRKVHVIVEKPLASSLKDCDVMLEEAEKTGIKFGMISQRRFYPSAQRIRNAIDAGKVGKPILGNVTMLGWRDEEYYKSNSWRGTWEGEGGGVLVNQAPHQIDLLQWYLGPVEQVFGCWRNYNHPYIEVDDTAAAIIRFKNGSTGTILVSNSQNPALYGKVSVFGDNGAAVGMQTDSGAMFIAGMTGVTDPPINDVWTIPGEEENLSKWELEDKAFFKKIDATEYFHRLQIKDFLNSIINDTSPLITAEEGRKTVEIFTAVYRSNKTNKPVPFPLT